MKTTIAGAVFGAVSLAVLAVPAFAEADMRIGFVTINDAQHAMANKLKEEVEKRSKGAIKVSVFPAAQLGKIPRQVENLQLGAQAAFISPPGFLSGLNINFQVPDAPGLSKNFWHAQNTLTTPSFRDPFLKLAESQGIIGIALSNNGPSSIASIRPVKKLEDMKGMKARVLATKLETKIASVFGMTGVPMPYSEVLPALQQRTLDACVSNIAVMAPSKFFTGAKYDTHLGTTYIPSAVWISKRWLNKLPKDQQKMLVDLGKELESWWGKVGYDFVEKGKKTWTDGGGEVLELPADEQAKMMAMVKPLGDEVLGADPKTKDMYALFKAASASASDQPPK